MFSEYNNNLQDQSYFLRSSLYGFGSASYSDCSMIRVDRLEYHVREELNKTAARTMVVLNPLKV